MLAIEHDNGHASALLGQRLSQWLGWGRSTIIEPLATSAGVTDRHIGAIP